MPEERRSARVRSRASLSESAKSLKEEGAGRDEGPASSMVCDGAEEEEEKGATGDGILQGRQGEQHLEACLDSFWLLASLAAAWAPRFRFRQ